MNFASKFSKTTLRNYFRGLGSNLVVFFLFFSRTAYLNRDGSDSDEVSVDDSPLFYTPQPSEEAKTEPVSSRAGAFFTGLFGGVSRSMPPAAAAAPPPAAGAPAPFRPARENKSKKVRRKVDTNVINLSLGTLGGDIQVATGDVVSCEECHSCLSCISNLASVPGGEANQWVWACEFCGHENRVELEEEEKPAKDVHSVDYILEQAQHVEVAEAVESFTVFCIDISGSMCVSQPYDGKLNLLGDRTKSLLGLRGSGDDHNQRLPREKRGVTYISRLQAVQAAVQHQIDRIAAEQPLSKVAIITFNREVTVIGDGSNEPSIIAGDRLNDFDEMLLRGKSFAINTPLADAKGPLQARLFDLEEGGPTALGPAVVTALGMCEGKRGARIVVCTDGLANIGLGSVEGLADADEAAKDAAAGFYERVGGLAAEHGICVDVVGIEGDNCDLERLGRMAELAGGNVSLVNPLNLHATPTKA